VLFDWLARTSEAGKPVPFVDQAEQRILWDLACMLESVLPSRSPTTMQPCWMRREMPFAMTFPDERIEIRFCQIRTSA
jgi:hypothetical protein